MIRRSSGLSKYLARIGALRKRHKDVSIPVSRLSVKIELAAEELAFRSCMSASLNPSETNDLRTAIAPIDMPTKPKSFGDSSLARMIEIKKEAN